MAVTVAELLKGREKLPEEEKTAGATGMESLARAIQQSMLSSNENVARVTKTTTDNVTVGDLSGLQMDMLKEQKKTNSLLSDLLENESKYFENNKELLDRLLMSQEQMLERKTGTIEAIGKSTEPVIDGKAKKDGTSDKDFLGGALALGPLIGILAGVAPELLNFIKEKFPETIKFFTDTVKSFGEQSAVARDAERAGLLATKIAMEKAADKMAESAARNAAEVAEIKAAREAAKTGAKVTSTPAPSTISEADDLAEQKRMGAKAQRSSSTAVQTGVKGAAAEGVEAAAKGAVRDSASSGSTAKIAEAIEKSIGQGAAGREAMAGKSVIFARSKQIAKSIAGSAVRQSAKKAIPILGAILSVADAGYRVYEGDYLGAAESLAVGGLSQIPVIGTAAGLAGIAALTTRDVYRGVYGTDPLADASVDPAGTKKKFEELVPIVWDALKKEWEDLNSSVGSSASLEGQEPIYDPMSGNVIGYQPKLPTGGSESGGTGRREPLDAESKPAGINPAISGQGYTPPVYPAPRATPNLAGSQGGSGTVINDNRVINNVDNSKAGGGGSAPGFPNSSTAPSNPWDKPLYGDNMYYY